ncbi:MAG: L-seryl-tRNA(Sec) selenium transferase [Anaerolineae bacterium]|nr:L-seryl-tRNA(Sec) selenium transferase [Anaerolineae bacterium]
MSNADTERDPRRQLPAVSRLLDSEAGRALIAQHGRTRTVAAIQHALDDARAALGAGDAGAPVAAPGEGALLAQAEAALEAEARRALQAVINATGVVIHTNLGRVPLSEAAQEAVRMAAHGYTNLEYRLDAGERGGRGQYVEAMLCALTGAEAALVVNNAASAVLLALTALAEGGDVVISRGQLIEIGGGFRVPEVMAQSGARLVEVGTTNRTRLSDYEAAITEATRLVFAAHHSNFRIIGFYEEPHVGELAALAHAHGLPMLHDVGSGALLDTAAYGLAHEPTPVESVAAGADLVTFSGDKLLGGPQAGCIVGRADLVALLRRHALARAVRIDKYCMAGLGATLRHYIDGEAEAEVPVWRMMARPLAALKATARRWARALAARGVAASVKPGLSKVGGGSLPEETLPTFLVILDCESPDRLMGRLRRETPPVVARVEDDHVVLDPRTVLDGQEDALLHAVARAVEAL